MNKLKVLKAFFQNPTNEANKILNMYGVFTSTQLPLISFDIINFNNNPLKQKIH